MKIKEELKSLRELDLIGLRERLSDAKQELFNLRFQHAVNQLDNPKSMTAVKKDIARVKTFIRQQESAQ